MPLTYEMLTEIRTQLETCGHDAGKRTEPRAGMRAPVVLTPFLEGRPGPADRVWIRNLSRSGLCVLRDRPMEIGQQFNITLPTSLGTRRSSVTLLCIASQCRAVAAGLFTVGAAFA